MSKRETTEHGVTVVTISRERPGLLKRAVASVVNQDFGGPIEHLVVLDEDEATFSRFGEFARATPRRTTRVHLEMRPEADDPAKIYPRLARLLNRGVELAQHSWIAFLDDDNTFAPNHVRSLFEIARAERVRAVHSGRTIHWPDGAPYLEPVFPHARSAHEGRRIYDLLCDRGVWVRGTNVLLDRADPVQTTFRNSTVMAAEDPVLLVDQNVWLLERQLLIDHPISADFSEADVADGTAPDDKLVETLHRQRIAIARSGQPTVQYFLGGVSNPGNAERSP